MISALEAGRGQSLASDQRLHNRMRYRVKATLRLYSDLEGTPPWVLFTRDVGIRGIGFITRQRLPLGYGGTVRILTPGGNLLEAAATLLRCRIAAPGWYEGSLYFNRDQPELIC